MANSYDNGTRKLRGLVTDYRAHWGKCDKAYDAAGSSEALLALSSPPQPLLHQPRKHASGSP